MDVNGQKKISSQNKSPDIQLGSLKNLVLKIYLMHQDMTDAYKSGQSKTILETAQILHAATWKAHVIANDILIAIKAIELDRSDQESKEEESNHRQVVDAQPIETDTSDQESNDDESSDSQSVVLENDDCQIVDDQPSTSTATASTTKNKSKSTKPLKNEKKKKFQCAVCPYKTNISTDFKRHLMMHADERPFECFDCKKRFIIKSNLKEHMRTHTIDPEFNCRFCGKNIVSKQNLKPHELKHARGKFVKKTTTVKKRLKCKSCKFCTNQATHLKSHMMIHSGEKPFECTICKKAFRQKHHLTEHMRTHTGEKPFRCRVCENTFAHQSTRDRHMASKHLTI